MVSCNQKTKSNVEKLAEDSFENNKVVETPLFKDTVVNNYISNYTAYIDSYIEFLQTKNTKAIKRLNEESKTLIEEAKIVSQRINTPEMVEKYKKWIDYQQKRIKLINIK